MTRRPIIVVYLIHYFLAILIPASIQSRNSIAKDQYRISNTGKTNTKCLSSTKTQLLFGELNGFENFGKQKIIKSSKQLIANNYGDKI